MRIFLKQKKKPFVPEWFMRRRLSFKKHKFYRSLRPYPYSGDYDFNKLELTQPQVFFPHDAAFLA